LSPTVRVYVATGTTDLRRSIDGLSMLVRERLALDPLSGHLFLFRNRRGDRVKILAWDRSRQARFERIEGAEELGIGRNGAQHLIPQSSRLWRPLSVTILSPGRLHCTLLFASLRPAH